MKSSLARPPLRAVFFDAGSTILHPRRSVGETYARAAGRRGHPVDPAAVTAAFRSAWKRSLERRRAAGYSCSDELLRGEWRTIVAESLGSLVPARVAAEAFEELYEYFSGPEAWTVVEGAVETFEALRAEGIALGILSNWDARLLVCLDRLGIRRHFDHLVVSFAEGIEKPHPRIFEIAAERADVKAGSLLMVGDSLELDIRPALALGWRAIWVRGEGAETEAESGVTAVGKFTHVMEAIRQGPPEV